MLIQAISDLQDIIVYIITWTPSRSGKWCANKLVIRTSRDAVLVIFQEHICSAVGYYTLDHTARVLVFVLYRQISNIRRTKFQT